jgi:thioesterase domain-containing protein/SAM-dependent methyltransferase
VLELGCGTGLLLFRVAPQVSFYLGTDVSKVGLEHVRRNLPQAIRDRVQLLQRPANDLRDVPTSSFDVVVLNSVAQYFASVHDLIEVVEGMVAAAAPGGVVYLGDLRSLPLLEALHTSIQVHRASPDLSTEELKWLVRRAVVNEEELLIDPMLFYALQARIPRIRRVEVLHERGTGHNELTRFRYDVFLHIEPDAAASPVDVPWIDWGGEALTIDALRQRLKGRPEALGVARVPNARVLGEVRTVEVLRDLGSVRTAGELRAAVRDALAEQGESGVDPEAVWRLADEAGYHADLVWSGPGADAYFDVVLVRRDGKGDRPRKPSRSHIAAPPPGPFTRYTNNPLQSRLDARLTVELRALVREKLPEYMVPGAIVLLDKLPLTSNGKIDRKALPAPDDARRGARSAVAPRDDLEVQIAAVWRNVLGLKSVGVTDSFFDLGGHSLLAVRMLAEIKQAVGRTVPLVALFQAQTIDALAKLLRAEDTSKTWSTLVPIKPTGSKRPLFLVSRPNVNSLGYLQLAKHLDPEQPVYGLQYQYPEEAVLGRPYTQDEYARWASTYIEMLRSVQPEGPYLLGGMCEGALIAFQMARQLEEKGQEVALLAMMDAWPEENTQNRLLHQVFIYEKRLRWLAEQERKVQLGFVAHKARGLFRRLLRVEKAAPRPEKNPWDERIFPGRSFVPTTVDCKITVFRVTQQPYWRIRDEYLGWRSRTKATAETLLVPGDHFTFLRLPHVQEVAKKLNAVLQRVEAELGKRGK